MMFSDEFFEHIAEETNRYARQEIQKKIQAGGRGDPVWEQQEENTVQEMKAFFSTVIAIGINKQS